MRIDLLALASAPEPVEHSGRTFSVRPLSAAGWQFLQDWEANRIADDEKIPKLIAIAAKHVDAPREVLEDWTIAELQAVLLHAGGMFERVKHEVATDAGNAAGRPTSRTTGARSTRTKR